MFARTASLSFRRRIREGRDALETCSDYFDAVLLRFVTLALAQAFDFATFDTMVGVRGPSAEANPLIEGIFLALGTPAVVLAKVALVTLIVALGIAAAVRGRQGVWAVVGGVPLAVGIAAGLVGGITNTATLLG